MSAEDDRAVMERMAALEAEVKADVDAQRARKDAVLAKLKQQRAEQQAERDELRPRPPTPAPTKPPAASSTRSRRRADAEDTADSMVEALALARRAHGVKQELVRAPKDGEKSWVKAGIASMALGPLGWLYAGSFREAVPASAAWLAFAALASKLLPMFLLLPVLMVALPASGIAGAMYAVQYNRKGGRQRLFGDKSKHKPAKQLQDLTHPTDDD